MATSISNWDFGKKVCLTMAILLCGLLATSNVYGQRARGQGGIKGGNVKSITYGKPGTTTQVGMMTWTNGKWVEKNRDGTFEFTEESRDEWSVYLVKSDGMKLQIDLYRNKIKFGGREPYDVLTASASGGAAGNSNATYNVTIVTGKASGSGTDSNISLTIHGSKGSTAATVLNPKIAGNAFENGKTDRVTLSAKDVGQINAITLASDNAYPGSDWYVESVAIAKGKQTKKFRFQRWFKTGAPQHRVNAVAPMTKNRVKDKAPMIEIVDHITLQIGTEFIGGIHDGTDWFPIPSTSKANHHLYIDSDNIEEFRKNRGHIVSGEHIRIAMVENTTGHNTGSKVWYTIQSGNDMYLSDNNRHGKGMWKIWRKDPRTNDIDKNGTPIRSGDVVALENGAYPQRYLGRSGDYYDIKDKNDVTWFTIKRNR